MAVVAAVLAVAGALAHRPPRGVSLAASARSASTSACPFAPSDEPLGREGGVELFRDWFTSWGLTPPDDAPHDGAKRAGKKGKGGGGKGGGGFGAPAPSSQQPLRCEPPPAGFVTVLRASTDGAAAAAESDEGLRALGEAARRRIDELLPASGAVLVRGLPMRTADAFSQFWRGVREAPPALVEGRYCSMGPSTGRAQLAGIDLATNVPPEFLLLCHNELCYNPLTVGTIALYCVAPAPVGGETLVARNEALARSHSDAVRAFVDEHGGLLYERAYYDANHKHVITSGATGSWQDKCGLPRDAPRSGAEAFFAAMGFAREQLHWDDDGGLVVRNVHPGYRVDPLTGERSWWNIAHTGSVKAADGTPFPKRLVAEVQRTGWAHTYAFKLLAGDWLVLDNLRVQHGRLPYFADPSRPRCLLTVYDTPQPA
ncbi:hypothetical protein KFE25_011776 [Diacronema lutheri]|uniref:TauD/TfdA-like domain-containing protein n=2 Tax=Diacronema lutheri TaxID=2081491 RepID=A0A8J5XKB2_DIALT|nr:hypothetical protein KFE25_011776 [Diacronema lutheri]